MFFYNFFFLKKISLINNLALKFSELSIILVVGFKVTMTATPLKGEAKFYKRQLEQLIT